MRYCLFLAGLSLFLGMPMVAGILLMLAPCLGTDK